MRPVESRELHTGNPSETWVIPDRPSWHSDALCHGKTDLFFPNRSDSSSNNRQRWDLCRRCPVRVECFDAGAEETFGWWGGMSVNARGVSRNRYGPDPLGDIA